MPNNSHRVPPPDIFHTPQRLDFRAPSRQPPTDGDPLLVDKYMSHAHFGAGQLVLRPRAAKGKQHVRNDTMVRHVTVPFSVMIDENVDYLREIANEIFVYCPNIFTDFSYRGAFDGRHLQ